jgi:YVTN family beta-propeller protein
MLVAVLFSIILINANAEAQVIRDTGTSITNQTTPTGDQMGVGEMVSFNETSGFIDSIYVANSKSNTISVIDPFTNTVIKNITVGDVRYNVETFGNYIYIANTASDTVSVIDPATNTVIKNITVGDWPFDMETFGDSMYISNWISDTVSVIDPATNTVIKNITVGDWPSDMETFGDGPSEIESF